MRFNLKSSICLSLLCFIIAGCGGSGAGSRARARVYKVKGKVTFLGAPLIGAVVSFSPQGDQPAAVGKTNDGGEYSLMTYQSGDGAAAGDYKVVVMVIDSGDTSAAPAMAHSLDGRLPDSHAAAKKSAKAAGNVLPAKYGDLKQTTLTAKVDPSKTNTFDFDLK